MRFVDDDDRATYPQDIGKRIFGDGTPVDGLQASQNHVRYACEVIHERTR